MCIEKEESAEAMEQPIPNSGLRHRISTTPWICNWYRHMTLNIEWDITLLI